MKKLFNFKSAKFKIAGAITLLGGASVIWWNIAKNPGTTVSVDAGVNQDTIVSVKADSIKADTTKPSATGGNAKR